MNIIKAIGDDFDAICVEAEHHAATLEIDFAVIMWKTSGYFSPKSGYASVPVVNLSLVHNELYTDDWNVLRIYNAEGVAYVWVQSDVINMTIKTWKPTPKGPQWKV